MRHFRRNVFRLAGQNKGSFVGAVLIIAIGIFIYVAMMDTLRNLRDQVEEYYRTSSMADVFAQVSAISHAELERMKEIPGIAQVSGKMAEDVRILAKGQQEIVTVRLLSYDAGDALNRLILSEGFKAHDSLYLGGRMAGIYGYDKGEPLKLLWGGRGVDFSFAGICHAPDYIYSIPPGGAMIPDGEIYDVACIEKKRMEELTGRQDSLNELGFSLKPGYTYEDVRFQLAQGLQPYGLVSLASKEDQGSFNMVDGEMHELISTGTVLPAMFMCISVFMLYVVLKKMTDRDQTLIGTMKAFGMTDRELMGAYLLEGALVGAGGAVLGSVLAAPFGKYMFDMYVDFFNLPDTVYHNYMDSRINGLLIALGTGLAAVFLGVRDILSITPAQAMRARTPSGAGNLPVPGFLLKRLGAMEKMGCRSIARNPFRGFLLILAIGFPFSMASVLFSFNGVADQMYMDQFDKVQVYDLQLSLDRYVSPVKAAQSGGVLEGVEESEAVCTVQAEIKNENLSEFVMLYGLNPRSGLWRIMDNENNFYEPPDRGLIINSRIADKLHVKKGDMVRINCPGMTVEAVPVLVVQVIEESLGSGCYMSLGSFEQVFHTEPAANTVLLKTKAGKTESLKAEMLKTSRVTWLVDTKKITDSYRDMMGSMMAMIHMFAILAVASGGILIYNISMINIRERVTEFGTLMVLGESNREISRLLLFEQMAYFAVGILAGIPGSMTIRRMIQQMVMSDSYTIRIKISPGSYMAAFFICMGITLLACAAEMRFIDRIRLTEILKERE
ncbi:ABC transporter permease [Enterocloster citroniae]|uniref:ABC transporter permease n=1 Tax=Enterocloster citroniae TaxID=358743 RepID=UPI001D08FD78|nr:ABC transporter permease [Enterocloster citroniae]